METRTPRILAVDDDLMSCKVVSAMLMRVGYKVIHFTTGEDAQVALLNNSFDLALLDWVMPAINGADITSMIRSGEAGKQHTDMPVIAVTADLIRCPREECIAAGASDYMIKPLDFNNLHQKVHKLLQL